MLSPRARASGWLAGAAVVLLGAALAAPVLEVRASGPSGAALEVSLFQAGALWGGALRLGTGLGTVAAIVCAAVAVARMGRRGSRALAGAAAALVQLDVGLLRAAAWDVTGSGAGIAGTRFGLVVLGACGGLLLLATALASPAKTDRAWPARRRAGVLHRFKLHALRRRARWT